MLQHIRSQTTLRRNGSALSSIRYLKGAIGQWQVGWNQKLSPTCENIDPTYVLTVKHCSSLITIPEWAPKTRRHWYNGRIEIHSRTLFLQPAQRRECDWRNSFFGLYFVTNQLGAGEEGGEKSRNHWGRKSWSVRLVWKIFWVIRKGNQERKREAPQWNWRELSAHSARSTI